MMKPPWLSITAVIFTILGSTIPRSDGAKILLISVCPGMNHWLTFEHVVNELLERGHEITAISNYRLKRQPSNHTRGLYREVLIEPEYDFESDFPMESYYRPASFTNPFDKVKILWWFGLATTRHAFETDNVQRFMREEGLRFDLVIAEQFAQEAFLMFGHKFNAPIVTINTLGYTDYIDRSFGMITPLSFVPHFFTEFTDEMNFYERCYNVILTVYDWAYRKFIYLPEHHAIAHSAMPPGTLEVFLQVFRNLPQYNFLWKWETDNVPKLPPNVLLRKWIPQNDVLAHPGIKLFITHGGVFSTQESIYWAKPMLVFPFYGDQHGNALKLQKAGIGLTMAIVNVTVGEFQGKAQEILENPDFQINANRMSALFRDNPTDPLEEAVFWIEYVVRHHGAGHLKSAAVRMPWYQYLLLDMAAVVIVLLARMKPSWFSITVVIFAILGSIIPRSDGAKILLISAFPGMSHWLTFEHVVNELLERGHEITAISNYRLKRQPSNHTLGLYREVLIEPVFDFESDLPMESYYRPSSFTNPYYKLKILWWLGLATTRHAFEADNVQRFMREEGLRFDLVIAEQFAQEAFLMFGHKFDAPIVTINTLGYTDYIDRSFGMITPLSFVPHFFTEFTDEMNFYERCYNVILTVYDWAYRKFVYLPQHNAVAKQYFGTPNNAAEGLPSVEELEKNVSVILSNNHIISFRPRPKMIGMVDIAGLHIRPPNDLPQDIKEFVESSTKGTIYINFGTFLRSSAMPPDTLEVFLQVFRNLPQYNFLWKWETDKAPKLPPNVLLRKWIPQNDVLAHPGIKLFITHGGIFGAQEAIYWAKPMLFVPFYGDQHGNALKLQKAGIGLTMAIANVTVGEFQGKAQEILENPDFQINANRMSALFRDNPTDPLEEAVFWIEYVVRHHGAGHLKSAAVRMPWYQYLLLDMVAAVVGLFFVIVGLTKYLFAKICGAKHTKDLNKRGCNDSLKFWL
nr:UDP-glucuronosyltransferase 1-9-like [Aedes albopictus]